MFRLKGREGEVCSNSDMILFGRWDCKAGKGLKSVFVGLSGTSFMAGYKCM